MSKQWLNQEIGGIVMVMACVALPQGAAGQCQFDWSEGFEPIAPFFWALHDAVTFDDGTGPALYVAADGSGNVHRYNGHWWEPVGERFYSNTSGIAGGYIYALAVFNDGTGKHLYAGGIFQRVGRIVNGVYTAVTAKYVAKWNGEYWEAVGSNISGYVYDLAEYDDGTGPALYAGGQFNAPYANLAKWDGSSWVALSPPPTDVVRALYAWNDGSGPALYVGMDGNVGVPGTNYIAKWNGSSWSSVGGGASYRVTGFCGFDIGTGPALYAGGGFSTIGGVSANQVARWDGTTWSALGSGLSAPNANVYLGSFDDGTGPALYAAGQFWIAGGGPGNAVARWDGSGWSAMGDGYLLGYPKVFATFDDDGPGPRPASLFAVGLIGLSGSTTTGSTARWNGSAWRPAPDAADWTSDAFAGITAMTVWDEDGSGPAEPALLAVSKDIETRPGVTLDHIGRWNGAAWSPVGDGFQNPQVIDPNDPGNPLAGQPNAVLAFDDGSGDALYVGGFFTHVFGAEYNHLARWNGATWAPMETGLGAPGATHTSQAQCLGIFDDGSGPALYVGGSFSEVAGVAAANVAKWDGAAWSPLGGGTDGMVRSLTVYDDGTGPALYAGGDFLNADGVMVNDVAKWNGSAWSTLGTGVGGAVYSLAVYNAELYACGAFQTAGGASAKRIAKWNGASWSALGTGLDKFGGNLSGLSPSARTLGVFDDGGGSALYVAGRFETAGGLVVRNIAKWNGTAWSSLGRGLFTQYDTYHAVTPTALAAFQLGGAPALYVAGNFDVAGTKGAGGLAVWACPVTTTPGDLDCNGYVDFDDINPFVLAISDPAAYAAAYPDCNFMNGDCNSDGLVDFDDINPFVVLLSK